MRSTVKVQERRQDWRVEALAIGLSLILTMLMFPARARSAQTTNGAAGQAAAARPVATKTAAAKATTYTPFVPRRARAYYGLVWGIDSLSVRTVESGQLVRFSWRVLDPDKAVVLNDKKQEPELIDPRAGLKLIVPKMEFVGQMRQTSPPVAGREYWMEFSNPGERVKPGDRVSVVVGNFRADYLAVE